MGQLKDSWRAHLRDRPDSLALVVAETGESVTFSGLEAVADRWLLRHPELAGSAGRIWAYAVESPLDWVGLYLAALRVGAVAMPVEKLRDGRIGQEAFGSLGVSFCITDAGLEVLPEGECLEDVHLIKLTSGSTGVPKALRFSEAQMAADGRQIMRTMGIDGGDCNYGIIPLGHSYGLGNLLMPLILAGTRLVAGSAPFPQVIAAEIERYDCTVVPLVPPLIKGIVRSDLSATQFQNVRRVISAGSRLEPELARRFFEQFGRHVHNFYGSSETGGICYDRSGEATLSGDSVGTPLAGVELQVQPDGAILVRSEAVCGDQWQVSDLGELLPDGSLRLIGRDAELIKVAGKRLFLSEVERALCGLNLVRDAYVSHRLRPGGEVKLIALVQSELEVSAIRSQLRAILPQWKIPRQIHRLPELPHTVRGKKDRSRLEAVIDTLD